MRDKVSLKKSLNNDRISATDKENEIEILYKIKNSKYELKNKDITLELLEVLLMKRLSKINQNQNIENTNKVSKSKGIGGKLSFLTTILFIIVLLISIIKFFAGKMSSNDLPFQIITDLSRFHSLKCYGKQDVIDIVNFMIYQNTKIIEKSSEKVLEELIRPADKNFLLYGVPGTGKTLFIKKLSFFFDILLKIEHLVCSLGSKSAFNNKKFTLRDLKNLDPMLVLILAQPSDLMDKYVGETEKKVKKIFDEADEYQKKGKTVFIFIDEVDTFFSERNDKTSEHGSNMKSQFLSILDGAGTSIKSKVFFFGATNFEKNIDGAFLRRMGNHIEFKAPDEVERREIIKKNIGSYLFHNETKLNECVSVSNGMTQSNFASAFYQLNRNKFGTAETYNYDDVIKVFKKYKDFFGNGIKVAPMNLEKLTDTQRKRLSYYKYKIVGNLFD